MGRKRGVYGEGGEERVRSREESGCGESLESDPNERKPKTPVRDGIKFKLRLRLITQTNANKPNLGLVDEGTMHAEPDSLVSQLGVIHRDVHSLLLSNTLSLLTVLLTD